MFIRWKNKGILVFVYIIGCLIAVVIVNQMISERISFKYDMGIPFGFALLLAGIWTYLTGEEYIMKDGKKIKVDFDNRFFFMPMKIFGLVLLGIGSLVMIYGIFETIKI